MLKIYESGVPKYPLLVNGKDWYIEHKYDGDDALKFELATSNKICGQLAEEIRITDGNNRYIVKKIDEHGGYTNYECSLDLDDWRERFWKEYRVTDSTIKQVFEQIKPTGWTIHGAEAITKRATIESSEGKGLENVVAKDILDKASEVYKIVFNFDVHQKIVKVIDPSEYVSSGDFLTDELNLKSIGFNGSTAEFATRLYAYGKKDKDGNPLTFSKINGGKEYIDNNQYSNRIISVGWSDERYTVPEHLLEAATKKLDELSYPVRSYECDVRNFDENMYMYKVVTLVDRIRRTRIEHRVIDFKEYPDAHYYDVVTLSAVPPKIEASMRSIKSEISAKASESRQIAADAVLDAMNAITGKNGGHITIEMTGGNPESIRIQHDDGTETVADKNGVKRNGNPYLYLCVCGSIETGHTEVRLPEAFQGKEVNAILEVKEITPQKSTDVVQAISNFWDYDSATNILKIVSDCKMLDLDLMQPTAPKSIEINYTVIGR